MTRTIRWRRGRGGGGSGCGRIRTRITKRRKGRKRIRGVMRRRNTSIEEGDEDGGGRKRRRRVEMREKRKKKRRSQLRRRKSGAKEREHRTSIGNVWRTYPHPPCRYGEIYHTIEYNIVPKMHNDDNIGLRWRLLKMHLSLTGFKDVSCSLECACVCHCVAYVRVHVDIHLYAPCMCALADTAVHGYLLRNMGHCRNLYSESCVAQW